MRCRLTIGIAAPGPGMLLLLDQLGVAWEAIERWDDIPAEQFSALVINRALDAGERRGVGAYIEAGGAALDVARFLTSITGDRTSRRYVSSVAPAEGDDVFADIRLVDLHRAVRGRTDARHLDGLVKLARVGAGAVAAVPLDPEAIFTDYLAVRKRFGVDGASPADEIVARISKGEVRRVFERALQWLHEERRLPYLHRWRFPGRAESLFAYRIDSDYGTRAQVSALHEVAERCAIPLTWFLHVAAHADWLDLFTTFDRDECGLHCFRHRTFATREENAANIAQAMALVEAHGIVPRGFAAPNGLWNRGLAEAIEEAGFDYSSEFSLDYDNFPFHPLVAGRWSPVLQVPVHPVCIGSLRRVKASPEAMKRYFRTVIDRMAYQREPAILYHHPGHEGWDVMEDTFNHARERGLVPTTMGAYARWWRRRERTGYEAWFDDELFDDGHLTVQRRHADPDVALAVSMPGGRIGFVGDTDAQAGVSLNDLDWRPAPGPREPRPGDLLRLRRFSLTLVRHTIEDYNARARQ